MAEVFRTEGNAVPEPDKELVTLINDIDQELMTADELTRKFDVIRSEGYQTWASGGAWTLNPYPGGSKESYAWDEAWRQGKKQPCREEPIPV